MKKLLTLALTVVALFILITPGLAQQETERSQQKTENLPELESRQTFPAGIQPKCPNPPVQYLGGAVDGFGGGIDAVTKSTELANFLLAHPPTRQFDEGGANKLFGHSFRMRENCKVCAVQVEISMKDQADFYTNDRIYIYGKTITPADQIWSAPTGATGSGAPGTFLLSAFLPNSAITNLNQQIFNNAPGHWLNILAQDDHMFDYVKLKIWYY
ncbi:MAG: hypothetical protein HY231_03945 [Acidobacteria bacterium]|nr:hypothetical protein [Acidobacteriota bacterium]